MLSKKIVPHLSLIILSALFLIVKIDSLGIRASDTNVYFYTAKELLTGKILYKDIFFTNFPLIPYTAVIYFLLSGGNLVFYYFTATLEVLITGGIIYWSILKQKGSPLSAGVSSGLYLLSFLVLASSDHQSGVFLAALFVTASYAAFISKRFALTGVLTTLALLTKAYTLPLLLTYIIVITVQERKHLLRFIVGLALAGTIILLPSLLFAFKAFWHDIFEYSLTRSAGLNKSEILWFVLKHDFAFVSLLLGNLLLLRRQLFFVLFSLLSILFLVLYQDIYYLYLNVTIPLLALSLPIFMDLAEKKFSINRFLLPTVLLCLTLYNVISYYHGYNTLQKLPMTAILSALNEQKPPVLYGVHSLTPAFAFLTHTPLLNDIVDTNDNIFRKGYLNAHSLTTAAINQHALIVTEGAYYPEVGISQDALTDVVDKKLLTTQCRLTKRFPFKSEGVINSVSFFRC